LHDTEKSIEIGRNQNRPLLYHHDKNLENVGTYVEIGSFSLIAMKKSLKKVKDIIKSMGIELHMIFYLNIQLIG
jgi:hypothetical protein